MRWATRSGCSTATSTASCAPSCCAAPRRATVRDLIRRALEEDLGAGDVTTDATVPSDARARATIVQKAPGVIAALDVAQATFAAVDPEVRWREEAQEGQWREGGPV